MQRAWVVALVAACGGAPEIVAKSTPSPAATTTPSNANPQVWITGSLAKIRSDDEPRSNEKHAAHLVPAAHLSIARNEVESFQVHVRATEAKIDALTVRVRSLGSKPFDVEKNVRVFREAYMLVDRPSAAWGMKGSIPDALIPVKDELTGEPRNAFPTDVPLHQTRSAWLDVFVPEGTAPGEYTFMVEAMAGDVSLAQVPVRVRVRSFSLPSTSSLPNAFFMSPLGFCTQAYGGYERCGVWPGADGNPDRGIEKSLVSSARFLLNRRVTLANVVYAGSEREGWDHFDATYGALIHGGDGTRLRGAKLTSLQFVGIHDIALLRRWLVHAKKRNFASRLFTYRCDEPPRRCTFANAQREGTMVHRANEDLRWLLTGSAETIAAEPLQRDVNILATNMTLLPLPAARPSRDLFDAFAQRKNGALWWYQDCTNHGCEAGLPKEKPMPSYMIDASGVQNRATQWLSFVYDVGGELYHGIDTCWLHECARNKMVDPWHSAYASGGNGDGTLVYPGMPARIGGTSPTLIGSMRLEHIRDGFEDYEYLKLLAAKDRRAAEHIARNFARSVKDFEQSSDALEKARSELADAIEAAH